LHLARHSYCRHREGDKIDGKLTVLESWRGDLRPGEFISIPELASFKSPSSREIKTGMFDVKSDEPKRYVTGSQMICKEVVTEFRDFWRSLPQLDDKSGLNQMSEECDKILLALP